MAGRAAIKTLSEKRTIMALESRLIRGRRLNCEGKYRQGRVETAHPCSNNMARLNHWATTEYWTDAQLCQFDEIATVLEFASQISGALAG